MLRRPFRLFTLLRFFKFNWFRLLWVVQVANEVFLSVTKFSLFLLLYDAFKVVQIVWVVQVVSIPFLIFMCSLGCFTLSLDVWCASVFLLCSGLCSVVFGRLNSVSCLRLFMFVLLFFFSLFTSFQVVVGNLCCFWSFRLF